MADPFDLDVLFGLGELEASLIQRMVELAERGRALGWTAEEFEARLSRLIEQSAAWGETWLSGVLVATESLAIIQTFGRDPTRRLFPYLLYDTRKDDRVRPNHRHLQDFAAPPNHPVWLRAAPPNGHNCRCRLRPVTWREARRRGWRGDLPGSSARQILTWPGPDKGFSGPALIA